ncbi:MAG TPA: HEAT repeat domain-containing protein, partial [Pirellulales bacterium]
MNIRLPIVVALPLLMLIISGSPAQEPTSPPPVEGLQKKNTAPPEAGEKLLTKFDESKQGALAWERSLAAGRKRALAEKRPLLVVAGAPWCPHCTRLKKEMDKPEAQTALRRFVLVELNVDDHPADARELSVSGIPALRIIDARGQVIASKEGYQSADQLVDWLEEGAESAPPELPEFLTATDKPDEAAIAKLIAQMAHADALRREAAIRRLLPYPEIVAKPTVGAFREGKLAARLAALELLRDWKAPIAGLDPWRPETLTDQRLAALDEWVRANKPERPAVRELSEQERSDVERDLARLIAADDADVEALRERLARWRTAILTEVAAASRSAADDAARERLQALRYRLLASDALALAWPGGLDRLSSTRGELRRDAVSELVQRATTADDALLLELFKDPDPLVRELALSGLQKVAGDGSHSALAGLLNDPEPNMRAAVLKQLAEKPASSLIPVIAAYTEREQDPDLLIHAIRFLKAAKGEAAFARLVKLLEHESWQVRAEAAEAIAETAGSYRNDDSRANAYVALIGLLDDEDPFVISRALGGMQRADLEAAVEPLTKVIEKHPDLAPRAIEALVSGSTMRQKAIPHLRKYLTNANPAVRAAAIEGLSNSDTEVMDDLLIDGLNDAESIVRQAAAQALAKLFNAAAEAHNNGDTTFAGPFEDVAEPPSGGGLVSRALEFLVGAARKNPPKADKPDEPVKPDEVAKSAEKQEDKT